MKKSTLTRIIREEVSRLSTESNEDTSINQQHLKDSVEEFMDQLFSDGNKKQEKLGIEYLIRVLEDRIFINLRGLGV
jgi:hypothetical protein